MRLKLKMMWYILRGHTVAYNLTIRNGGIDLNEPFRPKAIISHVTIIGADVALSVPYDGPDLSAA